ncbi:MAG: ABC transporter permease [Methanomassiliicoccus sp.]|nr:ABC transporter permease [Methanomassiliicoccus sp.]
MAVRSHLRTFRYAAWLGWQMESNWTRPWLFLLYSIVRPIAATLILVVMFLVIKQGVADDPVMFTYVFLGATFFMYVAQVMMGATQVIMEDREHYQTLRQIYIAPISLKVYIVGRAMSKLALTSLSVVISIAFGMLVLGLPLDLPGADWSLFAASMVLGLGCILAIGIALAGVTFLTAKHSTGINEGIGGAFYLFCGTLFPLTVLPAWGQAIGMAIPLTYWLELVRRSLYPGGEMEAIGGLGGFSSPTLLLFLAVSTVVFMGLSTLIYRYADRKARRAGKVDMTTSY